MTKRETCGPTTEDSERRFVGLLQSYAPGTVIISTVAHLRDWRFISDICISITLYITISRIYVLHDITAKCEFLNSQLKEINDSNSLRITGDYSYAEQRQTTM